MASVATRLEIFPGQDFSGLHTRNAVGYYQISGHALAQVTTGATEFVNRMGRDIRVLLNPGDLITREIYTLSFGMAGQTVFLMGRATEVNGYIRDDPGMLLPARMQGPIFSPALESRNQNQTQG
jgi:hypothetical protein